MAPDVRGYRGSDKPDAVEAYDMVSLTNDVLGLIDSLGEGKAILIGHDWGAPSAGTRRRFIPTASPRSWA